jgi:hypothetical protein
VSTRLLEVTCVAKNWNMDICRPGNSITSRVRWNIGIRMACNFLVDVWWSLALALM